MTDSLGSGRLSPDPSISSSSSYYFAFGSNLSVSRMRDRVGGAGGFATRRLAHLPGWRLTFDKQAGDGSGYANLVPDASSTAEGALYELPSFAAIEALDGYEGAPYHYRRVEMQVQLQLAHDGPSSVPAWVYIATRPAARTLAPRADYLDHLLCGRDLLSSAYVRRLEATPTFVAAPPAPPPPQAVAALTSMGFSRSQAEQALTATKNNVEVAANFLLRGIF